MPGQKKPSQPDKIHTRKKSTDSIIQPVTPAISRRLTPSSYSTPLFDTTEELNQEIAKLRIETRDIASKLEMTKKESVKYRRVQANLESKIDTLEQKIILSYILSSVREDVQQKINESADFRALFENTTFCNSFVLSIDIRRSTELMLKAQKPEQFAEFIIVLCQGLSQIILGNFGVFDKFTGDGILAFFPDFCSGPDAGLLTIDSALKCHEFFAEHYEASRHCFTSDVEGIGLGIGIDFGTTYMVKIQGSLTLVGSPVVYACRMSGARAGDTLMNQPGFDQVNNKYGAYFDFEETTLNIKNEGETIAYRVIKNGLNYNPVQPDWDELAKQFASRAQNGLKHRMAERRSGKRLRAGTDRRKFNDSSYSGPQLRSHRDRRTGKERRKYC